MAEIRVEAAGARAATERETGPWRDDLVASLLATTLVLGLFLDGWNHINLQDGALGSFFTVWHALLYAGFTATALWVTTRNPHLYGRGVAQPHHHVVLGVPLRYPLAMVGLGVAAVGLVGDLGWHTAFGDEEGVARVIGPFHLFLFAGAAALAAAPLRSGWFAPEHYPRSASFRTLLPPLVSLTLVAAVAAFMFQWLSAFVAWEPSLQLGRVPAELAHDERVAGTVEFAGVARVLVTNVILVAPVLFALTRWRLPFGSATLLFMGVALPMSALTEFDLGGALLAAAIGGLVCDALVRALRPAPGRHTAHRLVAGATPLVLWTAYFLSLRVVHDIVWPRDLWLGTVGLTVLTTLLLSFLAVPPAAPASRGGDAGHPPG